MKIMNFSRISGLAGVLLGTCLASGAIAQSVSLSEINAEADASSDEAIVLFEFQGDGSGLGFQCDILYNPAGIAAIDLSDCLNGGEGPDGTCVFVPAGDHTGGVIRIAIANADSSPLADFTGQLGFDLDGSLAVGDRIDLEWDVDCLFGPPATPVATTDGAINVVEGVVGECSLAIDPASHDFGTVQISNTASQSFTITNEGDDDCTGLVVDVSGDAAFSLGGDDCGATLGEGASCSATVDFSPAAEGNFVGSLDVNAAEDGANAALSGAGSEEVVAPPTVAIPTMNAMGLALMALLMLMIGVVSVRTFRS